MKILEKIRKRSSKYMHEQYKEMQNTLNEQINENYNKHSADLENINNTLRDLSELTVKNSDMLNEKMVEIAESENSRHNTLSQNMSKVSDTLNEKITEQGNITKENVKHSIEIEGSRYNALSHYLNQINETLNTTGVSVSTDQILVKQLIENKWRLIDKFFHEPSSLSCMVCGTEFETTSSEVYETKCIFGGGKLIRYKCSKCGAIIGPVKMLELSEPELGEEYKLHYEVYNEGNTTDAEIRAFLSMNPEKGKKYLNYGSGGWSQTIPKLREQGYDVYGYEPYASTDSEFIITELSSLLTQEYDGVFSHDLLEHLRDPIGTFEIFAKILKKGGVMAHATACYKYLYEYTRFHLIFYTGDSIDYLCEKCNLKIIGKETDSENLYINYLFEKGD